MLEVQRLYPQYKSIADRRQNVQPVSFERRSGVERRSQDRVQLDTNLTRDIFEIKSKINQIQKPESNNVSKVAFTQKMENSAINSLKADTFVKSVKDEPSQNIKPSSKSSSGAAATAGVLACALGGALLTTFLGPVAGGVALGIGAYVGGKFLKQAIEIHMRDKK